MVKFNRTTAIVVMSIVLSGWTQTDERELPGFGVSPTKLNVEGNAGQAVESWLTIAAVNSNKITRYSLEIGDLGQSADGKTTVLDFGLGQKSCASWIKLPSEIEIPENERLDIPISFNFPRSAPGHYFATITVRYLPEKSSAQYGLRVLPSIIVYVEAMILGKGDMNIEVSDMKIGESSGSNEQEIILTAGNPGNWRLEITGDILIYGPSSVFPRTIPIPLRPGGKPYEIYPGYEIDLKCPVEKSLNPGKYKAQVRLMLNGVRRSDSSLEFEIPNTMGGKTVNSKILARSEFDLDIRVKPNLVALTLTPGAVRTIPIQIQNMDERTADIKAYISDVRMEIDGSLTFADENQIASDWISITPETLTVASKRTTSIKATVKVPRDTSGFSAFTKAVRIRASGPLTVGGRESSAEFGVIFVANDPKEKTAKINVSKPELVYPTDGANPSAAIINVSNRGRCAASFKGKIKLERSNGQLIAFIDFGDQQEEIILPGALRKFRMPLPPVDLGAFNVKAEFVIPGSPPVWTKSQVSFTASQSTPAGLK